MKKITWISTLVIFLFLISCGSRETFITEKLTPVNGNRYSGGIFNVNESEYIKNLFPPSITDVYSYRVASQIYEGLFTFDSKTLDVKPSLVESYEVNESGTIYTFTIKKGVKFQDDECFEGGIGREMTAQDISYCFHQLCTKSATNQGFQVFQGIVKGADAYYEASEEGKPDFSVAGIEVIDDYTLRMTLNEPYSLFLTNLARPFTFIYPKEALDYYGLDMRINTVGTGPFEIMSVEEDIKIILKRNEKYHRTDEYNNPLPLLDAISVSFINDKKSELFEFKKGNLDMIYRLPTEYIIEILEETARGEDGEYSGYILQREPEMVTQFLVMNTQHELFSNIDVRKAFSYAIDREKILNFVLNGEGYAMGGHGITPPVFENYPLDDIEGYSFDPDSARYYLDKAGFPSGKDFPSLKFFLNSEGTRNTNVAVEIQKQLSDHLNIMVDLEVLPFAQLADKSFKGDFELMRLAWYADFPSAENFLWMFYGKDIPREDGVSSYPNIARYFNDEFDEMYEKALNAKTVEEANELFRQAENVMIQDAPVIILWYDEGYRLIQSDIRNFPNNPMQFRDFSEVYFQDTEKISTP